MAMGRTRGTRAYANVTCAIQNFEQLPVAPQARCRQVVVRGTPGPRPRTYAYNVAEASIRRRSRRHPGFGCARRPCSLRLVRCVDPPEQHVTYQQADGHCRHDLQRCGQEASVQAPNSPRRHKPSCRCEAASQLATLYVHLHASPNDVDGVHLCAPGARLHSPSTEV